jgi:hypothetical protein
VHDAALFQVPQLSGENAVGNTLQGSAEFVEAERMIKQQGDDHCPPFAANEIQRGFDRTVCIETLTLQRHPPSRVSKW